MNDAAHNDIERECSRISHRVVQTSLITISRIRDIVDTPYEHFQGSVIFTSHKNKRRSGINKTAHTAS